MHCDRVLLWKSGPRQLYPFAHIHTLWDRYGWIDHHFLPHLDCMHGWSCNCTRHHFPYCLCNDHQDWSFCVHGSQLCCMPRNAPYDDHWYFHSGSNFPHIDLLLFSPYVLTLPHHRHYDDLQRKFSRRKRLRVWRLHYRCTYALHGHHHALRLHLETFRRQEMIIKKYLCIIN